jgi:hypothetical protein
MGKRSGKYGVGVRVVRPGVGSAAGIAYTDHKRDLRHVCGLQGFGRSLDDRCPRCGLEREASEDGRRQLDELEAHRDKDGGGA